MKLLLVLLFVSNSTMAAIPFKSKPEPSLLRFTHLTAKEFGQFRGKPLTRLETLAYNHARKQALKPPTDEEPPNPNRFNFLGFVLGLLFPYGLIASYFFKDRSVRRTAWIGAGVALIIAMIILLSLGSK